MIHTTTRAWVQCSKKLNCPACGHDHDCTLSTDGLLSKCMRAPGGKEINQSDGRTAYLRRVSECGGAVPVKMLKSAKQQPKRLTPKEVEGLMKQARSAMSARRMSIATRELGVSEQSLVSLGMGWFSDYDCLAFPMFNGVRRPIGIRLRVINPAPGKPKYICVPGSANGLFVPDSYDPRPVPVCADDSPLVVLTPEGPTDVAAAIDMGFHAIGRPSNSGGQMLLSQLLANAPCKVELAILADHDAAKFLKDGTPFWPGWEGALSVAQYLDGHANVSSLKLIMPPKGSGKDLRDWIQTGGTSELILSLLARCEVVTPPWLLKKRRALAAIKREAVKLIETKAAATPEEALSKARAALFSAN